MGLYYTPNPPHIGSQQPLQPSRLDPPISGPSAQNPWFDAAMVGVDVLTCWAAKTVDASILPIVARNIIPQSGPVASIVPPSKFRFDIFRAWDLPPPLPLLVDNVCPPISAIPSVPRPDILIAIATDDWLTPPVARNVTPISGPAASTLVLKPRYDFSVHTAWTSQLAIVGMAGSNTIATIVDIVFPPRLSQAIYNAWLPDIRLPIVIDNINPPIGSVGSSTITGAQVTIFAGSVVVADSFVIGGAQVTAQAGTVVPSVSIPISGAQVTAQAGIVSQPSTVPITGAQVTASAGSVSETSSPSPAISGAAVFASAGFVSASGGSGASPAVTGAQVVISAGSVTGADSAAVTGAQVTAQAGSVAETISASILGASVTALAGSVTETAGGSATLSGAQVTISAGTVSFAAATNVAVTGVQVTTQAGSVSASAGAAQTITGAQVAAQAGNISLAEASSIVGAQCVVSAGVLVVQRNISTPILGAQVTVQAGIVTVSAFTPSAIMFPQPSLSGYEGNAMLLGD